MNNPPIVVYKSVEGEDRFFINFLLKTDSLKREFNFNRKKDETATEFIEALVHKIDKIKEKRSKKKKVNQDAKPEEPTSVYFRYHNEQLDPSSTELATDILNKACVALDICGRIYAIEKNPPFVEILRLSDRIMVGFPCYPSKFEVSFGTRKDSIFNWYTSDNPASAKNWSLIQENSYTFIPNTKDIGKFVKLEVIPKNQSQSIGRTAEVISKIAIDAGPGVCPFEKRQEHTKDLIDDSGVRVVSYNLLADLYADSGHSRTVLFPTCPPFALSIDYRKQLILKELMGYNADIICLQEVDKKVYKHDLQPILSSAGFASVFETKGGDLAEGLACFWRESKFTLMNSEVNVMNELLQEKDPMWEDIQDAIKAKPELEESIMKRKTAFLTVGLLPIGSSVKTPVVVGVSHLFFQPDADHIRLIQAEMCLRHFRKAMSMIDGCLLFCGDFNSVPSNGVYQYFLSGQLSKDHEDWRSCCGQEVQGLSLSHDLSLDSACGTPKYTNYTLEFKDCLDYIFYDKKAFRVDKVVPFPETEELGQALPNPQFPSDHIACIAELKWK